MEGFGQTWRSSTQREVLGSILATGFVLDMAQKITLTSLHKRRGEEGEKASPTADLFLSWKRLLEFFYFKLRKDIKTLGNIRELWSGTLNLTLNICQLTSSGA